MVSYKETMGSSFMRWCCRFGEWLNGLEGIPLLMFRIGMGVGFYKPFMFKLQNPHSFHLWLVQHHFPWPYVSGAVTTILQGLAVSLLPLGLLTRFLSSFLFLMVLTAGLYVHLEHGYAASNDGVEICVYYCLILLALVLRGPGWFSCDTIIARQYRDLPPLR